MTAIATELIMEMMKRWLKLQLELTYKETKELIERLEMSTVTIPLS